MSLQITEAFVQQYRSNVMHLVQQEGSRLKICVRNETINGKKEFFERIGKKVAQKKVGRHADTAYTDTPHSRRAVHLVDYFDADLIDKEDRLRLIINPDSDYARAQVNALGRAIDDEVIEALGGNAYSSESGTTTVPLPSAQKIVHGSAGLTIVKLLEAKKILDAAECPDNDRFIVVKAAQIEDLLNTSEVKSADYNTVKALVQGQVDTFCGFKFIRSERLINNGTSDLVYAFQRDGIVLATGADITVRMTEMPTKHYSMQVYVSMSVDAARLEEERVVEIACN